MAIILYLRDEILTINYYVTAVSWNVVFWLIDNNFTDIHKINPHYFLEFKNQLFYFQKKQFLILQFTVQEKIILFHINENYTLKFFMKPYTFLRIFQHSLVLCVFKVLSKAFVYWNFRARARVFSKVSSENILYYQYI